MAVTGSALLPTLLVTWACARWIDKGRLEDVGFGGGWLRALFELAGGAGLGIALIGLSLGVVALFAEVEIVWKRPLPGPFLLWMFMFFAAAAWEEVLFRGYAFQWLCKGTSKWAGTAIFALCFSVAHLTNPNVSAIGAVSILLAGVLLSLSLFVTGGRIWLPIGLHWGWNIAQGMVFGVPVSGMSSGELPTLLRASMSGPEALTGGDFGFEGSLVSVGWVCVACVGMAVWLRRSDQRSQGLDRPAPPPPEGDGATSRA